MPRAEGLMVANEKSQEIGTTLTVGAFAVLTVAVHLLVNAFGGYGLFRDELYYIACSRHLAPGYVDHPSLSIVVLAATRLLFGQSLFAIRLVPAVLSGLAVVLLGRLVVRLGGGRLAVVVASTAFVASPQLLAFFSYYSMNSIDIVLWLLAGNALVGVIERPSLGRWAWLGLALGLGLANKTSALWLCAGVAAAVLLTDLRRQLRYAGPYLAAAIAVAFLAPFVLWNVANGWPHLEFMRNAVAGKYSELTRWRFIRTQFDSMNMFTYLISLPGLWWCLFHSVGRRHRAIAIVFLTTFGILLANAHTKSEYIAAAYPMLFAAGGVALSSLRGRWRLAVLSPVLLLVVAQGIVSVPFAMPILPVETFIRYARALGVAPSTPEKKQLAELPQFYADMHGWEEVAQHVSAVYATIPEPERASTVMLVGNYGEAGAIEYYAQTYPLPRVICTHNAYWFWGPGDEPITTFIRLGGSREDYTENYGEITPVGVHTARYCMPYENNLSVFVVRQRKLPIQQQWRDYKHFE
jgi:hypothetical protein